MDPVRYALSAGSREIPLTSQCAVLVVDMQNAFVHADGIVWKRVARTPYVEETLASTKSRILQILTAARSAKVEILYTVVESLTSDGRELSLDYKLSDLHVPRRSWGARVVDELTPGDDDIVLPKGSSSVFVSTNITYLLRNLDVKQLVIVGGLTDQCVDSAVRDACDAGFLVTTVTDACYTHSEQRHRTALANNAGYCRQITTEEVLSEITGLSKQAANSLKPVIRSIPRPVRDDARFAYIRYEITDINGRGMNKTVPARHRDKQVYMYSGASAAGANSNVLTFPAEIVKLGFPNSPLRPDWSTEVELPWACNPKTRVTRVICEPDLPDGSHSHLPRAAVRRLLEELATHGLELVSASEFEFCLADKERKPVFDGTEIFVTLQNSKTAGFQFEVEQNMTAVGIDIQTSNAEYGPGQLEITYAPKRGVAAPDAAVTFRSGVKEIAQNRGLVATFMSKPFDLNGIGNGGHLNFSLWKGKESVMLGEDGELSKTARNFLGGILYHARSMEALVAPTPPCYGRHGNWAPAFSNYGIDDRTACIRVKMNESADKTYLEYRAPSSSANPYLVTAALLAAGLDGIESEIEPPPMSGTEEKDKLPTSLEDAIAALVENERFAHRLGKDVVRWFLCVKEGELAMLKKWEKEAVDDYGKDSSVAQFEALQRMYFEFL